MTPTVKDILDLLPIVAHRGWIVDGSGQIRDRTHYCPMAALGCEVEPTVGSGAVYAARQALGVELGPAWDIADASDFPDSSLRRALMRALEMTP